MFRGSMPELDRLDGFCGASMFLNRDAGITMGSTSWADRSALDSSREGAAQRRQRIVDSAGLDILEVAEFELVMAHLRVPEMA